MATTLLRVLVVDDNRDAADSLLLLLQAWGHEAFVAYDGPSAIGAARRHKPEVVLLDLAMPGLNGAELTRRLRQQPETAGAMVVCITGMGGQEHRRLTEKAGCDHYLLKPSDPEQLRRLLDSFAGV